MGLALRDDFFEYYITSDTSPRIPARFFMRMILAFENDDYVIARVNLFVLFDKTRTESRRSYGGYYSGRLCAVYMLGDFIHLEQPGHSAEDSRCTPVRSNSKLSEEEVKIVPMYTEKYYVFEFTSIENSEGRKYYPCFSTYTGTSECKPLGVKPLGDNPMEHITSLRIVDEF